MSTTTVRTTTVRTTTVSERHEAGADPSWHWELYLAVCAVGMVVLILLADGIEPMADRWLATGLVAAMTAAYLTFGRRIARQRHPIWRGLLFQAFVIVAFIIALAVVDFTSLLLFALCPLTYMTLPIRVAHGVVGGYSFAPALVFFASGGVKTLAFAVPLGVVILAFSIFFAETSERIERTSAERGRLIAELNETRAEVARLSREAGIAEERQRLAGDIHDTVAQGLSSVVMLVEAADAVLTTDAAKARTHLALAARTARENLDEARALVGALTPSTLAQASLVEALQRLAGRVGHDGGKVHFGCEGEPRPLPTGTEVVLLRVAQEALTNASKHAGATEVTVRLHYGDDSVALDVTDDGRGFDVAALRSGYGLDAMRSRVEQVGGRLTIHSELGKGTRIRTEVDG